MSRQWGRWKLPDPKEALGGAAVDPTIDQLAVEVVGSWVNTDTGLRAMDGVQTVADVLDKVWMDSMDKDARLRLGIILCSPSSP